MNRTLIAVLLFGALLAGSVQAQDPKPAAQAQPEAAKPAPGQEPDPKIIEGIMSCLAEGLTKDWRKAWFVIRQIGVNPKDQSRSYEANFFFATREADTKGERLQTCGAEKVLEGVAALNAYLLDSQKAWSGATFTFYRDGRYQANYDVTPFRPKPEAKKSPAKKKQDTAK